MFSFFKNRIFALTETCRYNIKGQERNCFLINNCTQVFPIKTSHIGRVSQTFSRATSFLSHTLFYMQIKIPSVSQFFIIICMRYSLIFTNNSNHSYLINLIYQKSLYISLVYLLIIYKLDIVEYILHPLTPN